MSGKIKLALLGCGDVATRDYLPEFHRIADRAEIVAVCGRGEARARAVAAQYGIQAVYTNYRRMLAETDAPAVINLTPIQLHFETNLAALRAGKHVYTEKPVAATVAEAALIRVEALKRGLKLVCAPSVMLWPQFRLARSILDAGEIGEVYFARGHAHSGVPPWTGYTSDPSQFFITGGGPAMDMAVYPLHAITGLLGPARRVSGVTARAQRSFTVADGPARGKEVQIEVDDNWHATVDLGGGRIASVDATNVIQDTLAPQLEIFGLRGTVALNVLDVSAPVQVLQAGGGWQSREAPRTGRGAGPDHLIGIEHLVDCIEKDTEPAVSIEHAIHVVEIIEKAGRSSAEGRAFNIDSTF